MLIDIHTHRTKPENNETIVHSINLTKALDKNLLESTKFTIGLHPWWIDQVSKEEALKTINQYLSHKNCLGLGEIGLDRAIETPIQTQVILVKKQIELAIKHKTPFIMLHCVRAYDELFQLIKKSAYQGKVVFHDYNGNQEITHKLLKAGCYFSYGKKLFEPLTKGHKSLSIIPLENLFLETDEHNFRIQECYERLSELKSAEFEEIESMISESFSKLS